jgi:hypothetical protein
MKQNAHKEQATAQNGIQLDKRIAAPKRHHNLTSASHLDDTCDGALAQERVFDQSVIPAQCSDHSTRVKVWGGGIDS